MSKWSPWSACNICGEEYPEDEMVRHYRSGKLVDIRCADEPGFIDLQETFEPPDTEGERSSEQPLPDQGSVAVVGFGDFNFGEQTFGVP